MREELMKSRLITCPETAHLELIDFDATVLGMIILGCSRFQPSCAIACTRTCAARLDRREQEERILDIGDDTNLDVLAALR
jgi:hypothetical protein